MKTNSYKKIIQSHVMGLGVCKEEQMSYYREVHRLMAMGGIIDPQTLMADRKKPFKNSPWGEFKNYEYRDGKRVHVDSYILNEQGVARVNEILTKYVTDRYLTKGKLTSADPFVKEMRGMVDGSLLVAWLANKGVEVTEVKKDAQPHSLVFTLNNRRHTYYHKENLVVWSESQGKNAPVKKSNPFWFIKNQKTHQLSSAQEKAIAASGIFAGHWNVKFGNGLALSDSKAAEGQMSQRQADKPVTDNSPMLQQILAELNSLKAEVDSLKRAMGMSDDSDKESSPDDEEENTKDGILAKVKKLSTPLTNPKRYKTISIETITKEKNPERKKLLQQAYDILKERRLLTATNRPHDGWKFDFLRKSIELLFRVDNRRSAVYNTRHRPLIPRVIDGEIVKEEATAGEQYSIPYGMEKINYSYKTIFVTEGIYDSCFLKNCLAYSNWILPNKMSKVLDIYREAGFQIIHILDNFRLGDKGGVKGLEHIVTRKEWLSKGDKVFSWDIYSECDDLNDVAIAYELDEIDPQAIIDHSWNEDEAESNYQEFVQMAPAEEKPIPTPSTNKESIYIDDDEMNDFLAELEAEEQKSIAKAKERELMKKRYEDHLEQEQWELNRTMKSVFSSKACV